VLKVKSGRKKIYMRISLRIVWWYAHAQSLTNAIAYIRKYFTFFYSLNIASEFMYYWTSGASFSESAIGRISNNTNITWCSSNVTSTDPKYNLRAQQKSKQSHCVAYERWTQSFKRVDCNKKLSFICEVSFYSLIDVIISFILISTLYNASFVSFFYL